MLLRQTAGQGWQGGEASQVDPFEELHLSQEQESHTLEARLAEAQEATGDAGKKSAEREEDPGRR